MEKTGGRVTLPEPWHTFELVATPATAIVHQKAMGTVYHLNAKSSTPQEPSFTYIDTVERILEFAGKEVSMGAVVLLHHIAYLQHRGRATQTYGALSDRIGVDKRTVMRYVAELEYARMLNVARGRKHGDGSGPCHFEISFKGALGRTPKTEPEPVIGISTAKAERMRQRSDDSTGGRGDKTVTPQYIAKAIYKDNTIPKGIERERGRSRIRPAYVRDFKTVEDAIDFTAKKSAESRTRAAAKAATTQKITAATVRVTWQQSMLEYYPTVPPLALSQKDLAIFKARIAPIVAVATMQEFFTFVVSSWATLRSTKFAWLRANGKDLAVAPSIPELMRYWKIFAQAFADSKASASVSRLERNDKVAKLEQELRETKSKLRQATMQASGSRHAELRAKLDDTTLDTPTRRGKSLSDRARDLPQLPSEDFGEWDR